MGVFICPRRFFWRIIMRLSGANFLWISAAYIGASYTLVAVLTALVGQFGFYEDVTGAFAAILVALILAGAYKLFHTAAKIGYIFKRFGQGLYIGLPGIAAGVWYLFIGVVRNDPIAEADDLIRAVIVAFATAFFEETIFRAIVLSSTYYCRRYTSGKVAFALIYSSLFYAVVQYKDIIGEDIVTVLITVIHAFVMGMLYGALYLRSRNLFSVIVIHWINELFRYMFGYGDAVTPGWTIYIYALIQLFVLFWAIYLLRSSRMNSVYGLWGSYNSKYKRYK